MERKKKKALKKSETDELKKILKEKEEELLRTGELMGKWMKELDDTRKELEEAKSVLEIKVKARTRELEELNKNLEERVRERTRELEESRVALINILEDVEEERKKADEEKNKTLAIVSNFADGLLVFDREGFLVSVNPQAEKFLTIDDKEILGKSAPELKIFPSLKNLADLLLKESSEIYRKEMETEKNLTLEVSTIPIIREGEKFETLVILHDVTREKMVEKIKTEFVSVAAHQLRTPISATKWTLRMILDGDMGEISSEQKDILEKTYESNERMIALINDLLDVTRIEEGRYLFNPTLTEIEPIVQFVVNSCKAEAERRNIKLEFDKESARIPKIVIDVEKVRMAIQNLVDNALRYTSSGGKIQVSLGANEKEVKISVKDTGVGIPKSQAERVFTKFFRAANVIRMETEGSGLGLFIAKNIIEAHGGRIWFETEEGKGTTFYFTLPIQKEFTEFLKEF
ncbi:MAG: ATP-binding protein [Candidatus Pacebacteria bacterium]|nr:ATP-binding protein [Candidatus Paceibacterota bacterium]